MRIHLDTDLGSDPDDACALAMLLGRPGVEVVGITTTIDPGGRRAGYVKHCLSLAGRDDIPVAAGAEVSLTTLVTPGEIPEGERYWPAPVPPDPSPPGAAIDLLALSIVRGATVAVIGPYTNLALLEEARPGVLGETAVVVMGGWIHPPADGFPQWGPERDWNVQCDTRAAATVFGVAQLTMVTLAATAKTHLRRADLPRLRASGPLGDLLAHQTLAHAEDHDVPALARTHERLPDDLLNFHHDPLTCAVAAAWPGAPIEELRLEPILESEVLRFEPTGTGRLTRVVSDVDGDAFGETWLKAVEAAQGS